MVRVRVSPLPVMDGDGVLVGLTVGLLGTVVGAGDGPAVDGEADDGHTVGSAVGRVVGADVEGATVVGIAEGDVVGAVVGCAEGSKCRVSFRMRLF